MKKKILIIANQMCQYHEILNNLKNKGYNVFPEDDESFITFINHIRISLNPRYVDRCNASLNKIIETINKFKPNLLIVDHVLVGCHSSENGIDLVRKLIEKEIMKPIIFFSRTERNNADVCESLAKIDGIKYEWKHKGYSGDDILDSAIFKNEIIPAIESLCPKDSQEIAIKLLMKSRPKMAGIPSEATRQSYIRHNRLISDIEKGFIAEEGLMQLIKKMEERGDQEFDDIITSYLQHEAIDK